MINKQIISMTVISLWMAFVCKAQNNNLMEKSNFTQAQNEVLNAILKMDKAFHQKDIDGVMASYEPGAQIIFEPEKPISDAKIAQEMFQNLFVLNPKVEFSGHEVFIQGNLAIHFAPWEMKGVDPEGNEVKQGGLSVAVLRKQTDGKWLFIFDNPNGQFLLNQQ